MHIRSIRSNMKAMPKSLTVRNVPDQTCNELAARAARSGRSLQEYLRRELISMAETPDMETVLARIETRIQATKTTISTEEILEHLHADRK